MSVDDQDALPGRSVLRLNAQVTLVFVVLTIVTHLSAEALDLTYAIVSTVFFVAGIALSLLGFWNGIQRSKVDEVSLAGLLAVDASFVQRVGRNWLWLANLTQIGVAIVAASLRPFTQQAFGLLVPMFGIGMATLWGSRHASFHPRDAS